MERVDLRVESRQAAGKGAARSLRRTGVIPAVVYGGKEAPQSVSVSAHQFYKLLQTAGGEHLLLNLRLGDSGEETLALLKETQHNPIRGDIEHIDFQRVSVDNPIHTSVTIHPVGSSVGSREGGIFEHLLRELEIECLPLDIPDEIEIDVSHLEIGDAIHVSELTVPENVRVLTNPETVVAAVAAPTKVAAVVRPEEEGEAPAEEGAETEGAEEGASEEASS